MEIDGLEDIEMQNTQIDDLETETINLMFLAIDESGSMDQYENVMKEELTKFKESIINSKESENILVSRADFSEFIKIRGYKRITEFDEDFEVFGMTRLYDVIDEGATKLLDYMNYLKQQGMRVKAVFAIFSDGRDNDSKINTHKARQIIDHLNNLEIVTVFVAFGQEAIDESRDLSIKNTLEVGRTESELRKAFNQLSKSLISQSKSVVPKKDDFFEM